jgi:hypothetical protein
MTSESIPNLIQKKNAISNQIVDLIEDDSIEAIQLISSLKRERKLLDEKIAHLSQADNSLTSFKDKSFSNADYENGTGNNALSRVSLPRTSITQQPPLSLISPTSASAYVTKASPDITRNYRIGSMNAVQDEFSNFNEIMNKTDLLPHRSQEPIPTNVFKTPKTPLHAIKHPDQLLKTYSHDPDIMHWSRMDFPWTRNIKKAMKLMFRIRSFRKNQAEIINAVMSGHDVFVLMPTGGGKSICYQVRKPSCFILFMHLF